MITIKHGNIFDSTADVLVCPVNCVGVMGAGVALEFKRRWPRMFYGYRRICNNELLRPGGIWWWQDTADIIIACAATKHHWRDPSRIQWVESCLVDIADTFQKLDAIALPQLGCGCGGLDWAEVWPLYEKHLGNLDCDVEVWIYE
jgi:O-acetyl-ADP-ribose deacetylase (regulator of RNase III)